MKDVTVRNVKKYLFDQVLLQDDIDMLSGCVKRSQISKYVEGKDYFYYKSLDRLYNAKSYNMLEYNLSMMNEIYHTKDFDAQKKSLFDKLIQTKLSFEVFRVLLQCQQYEGLMLIELLHNEYGMNPLLCARCALYIDEPYIAMMYLKELDECNDETVIRLLCGFSRSYYLELIAYYRLKKGHVTELVHA